ncbi:MAG TPA: TetR/AcrR family transcriptional regulator [Rhizomicrobium sp.]|nr:TetR/AcrR family transcriptional regulator [Rhizomicrobium sp.]
MSKDRIFAAAKTVLAKDGVSGLSIRSVAEAAGLSPMAMYRHFKDKDALLNALMRDGFVAWEEIARAVRDPDPIEWIEKGFDTFLAFALKQPHRFDAAFLLPATEARRYPDDFAAGRSPAMALFIARIDAAKAQGHFAGRTSLEIALALAALAQGMISMHRAGRFASERQFKTLYRQVMRNTLAAYAGNRRKS